MALVAGTKLGPYRVVALIGAGGMGEVYRARDDRLHRDVALKILQQHASGDAAPDSTGDDSALLREAQAACGLNDPHICTIYEVGYEAGESGGVRYIAMELVEGQPLNQVIPAEGMPLALVFRYGQQIASALAHAHDRGVIHRDIKTSNIVITPAGQAKILDFGLARRVNTSELSEATGSIETMGRNEGLAGTLPYMSPEILRGAMTDARSDVWIRSCCSPARRRIRKRISFISKAIFSTTKGKTRITIVRSSFTGKRSKKIRISRWLTWESRTPTR
jgi:eukaryotic-like serine/threonine-protein kinase